ncbi:phophatidylserine decarboxylase associated domain-containing protein [Corallococcus macrosporus]|uniref:Phosphatidylserine decarboxylase-related protein n=1 Tax=Myxococcus fulvus (strain ATCC BAA-855 / HW-1) TaxID=483219 RepID=F8CFV2_MYXFH|nr:phophatidylserine decarboxylase associated domain-containing protein [Corallococcus macrosporus]AEI64921.1 phosphatidylserine decarboxylase-related protein [Corallococcus macrosporus]
MSHDDEARLDARYRNLFGYRAGYLPRDRRHLQAWHQELKAQLRARATGRVRSEAVRKLTVLLDTNAIIRMYVNSMIAQVPAAYRVVENTAELLAALDVITVTAPLYNADPHKRNAFPMSSLFA